MKKETLFEILGDIDETYVKGAKEPMKKAKKWNWKVLAAIAACLILAAAIGIPMLHNQENALELSDASWGVTVKYIDNAPMTNTNGDLAWLTEEELFSSFDTDIFKGTITKIENIVMDFNGSKDYRAIAEIEIQEVYRGACQENDVVSVLLPCPIADGVWVEDTETISAMKAGMTGIFMLIAYDDTSVREENGAKLALKDIADYGFADGSRYAFLETEDGLVFAKWAYESIADATTLEQIENYVLKMIADTK